MVEQQAAEFLGYAVKSIIGALVAYTMYKIKGMETKVNEAMTRDEVKELVEDKIKPLEVLQKELKEDTKEINQKLERLLEHTLRQSQK
jgi:hypothetical protein